VATLAEGGLRMSSNTEGTSDAPRKKRDGCRWIVIGALLLLVLIIGRAFWRAYQNPVMQTIVRGGGEPLKGGLARVYEVTGIAFPDSAMLTNGSQMGYDHGYIWAPIEIDGDDLDAFLEHLPEEAEVSDDRLFGGNWGPWEENDWWDADDSEQFISTHCAGHPPGREPMGSVEIQISLDDQQQPVVYLMWIGSTRLVYPDR
jgi:hypothetical protein